ncbi:MAG: ACT domain-containing protein [Candidatus Caldatribacteriota bacterium]|nr:ACT domain-containing protein [Candidatus Caldatribacteriota bacterium]
MTDLENYFRNGKVYVWVETFAIIKAKKPNPNAFANVIDKNETTVIIDQSKYDEENIIEIDKDWKILTFDMVLLFELVGFLAKVSQVLADEKIPIFVISAYSKDHILVKEKDLAKAEVKLKELGCIVEKK